jgi:diguanylate cyclase (GGDEF)-like protein
MNEETRKPSCDTPDTAQTRIDELTGLPDRGAFLLHLAAALAPSEQQQTMPFAVLLLDCDKFKTINDSLGHHAGDQVLVAIAERLYANLSDMDVLARIGGDEFAILMYNIINLSHALATTERILRELDAPFAIAEQEVFISASIGIVTSEAGYTSAADILRDADTALYHAKALGRGRYSVFDPHMHARAVQRLKMETELRRALNQEEFCVFYQPIVSLSSGVITGFETLVRWQHPERQLLLPADFLPIAEELGLSVAIDRWVLRTACQQMHEWIKNFPATANLSISVNISGRQFEHPDLVSFIRTVLRETRLPPQNLVLEMTEETVIEHKDTAIKTLQHLQAMGIKVSLDDFGTGYSSLSYLHYLPISTLKVDRSFISGMDINPQAATVANTIIMLAHALGMDVVAEGIETVQHLNNLRAARCERAQGFFFSRPVDVLKATALLEESLHHLVSENSSPRFIEDTDHQADEQSPLHPQPMMSHPQPAETTDKVLMHAPDNASPHQPDPPEQSEVVYKDPLTGMLTRASLQTELAEAAEHSMRSSEPFALAVLDIDHFKSINDAFGHARGDEVLIEFAARVAAATRAQDTVFRYGGDEFVLLLRNTKSEQAYVFAERLLDIVRSSPFRGDPPLYLTISMGIAIFPMDSDNLEDLFNIADERNYQAKRSGRGRAVLHDMPQMETVSLDGPSRLIERDQQLQVLHEFLQTLPHQRRGVLQIGGAEGSGITRFLAEAARAARLQGYGVIELSGSPALKERVYGVLSEFSEEWQDLPLPGQGVQYFATQLQEIARREHYSGIVITLDRLSTVDQATIEFLQALFTSTKLSNLALIYATSDADTSLHLPQDDLLRMHITLEPLSLNGLRTWVRHSLNWEMPESVLLWFYGQTNGRPAAIRRGLHHMLHQEMVYPVPGGWGYWSDIITTRITEQLDRQPARPMNPIPTGQSHFVGREAEIKQVKQLLQQNRAVTIVGLGGLGKSRLAMQAAAESVDLFADGVCYISLAHLSSSEFLIYTIADALGVSLVGSQSPKEQVLFFLSNKRLLLLLDNFEHLREETFLLEEIVQRAAGVHLLVTSRDHLVLPGVITFDLVGLSYPTAEQSNAIEQQSSVQLFVRCAQQVQANFTLAEDNRSSVSRICRLVEGMPLGIELAAAWTRTFSCEAIADKIALNLSFLRNDDSDVADRHRSLLAMVNSFWFLLSNHERRVLRQIAVFRGGFDGSAARQIMDASPFFLEGLVAKGYIRWTRHKRYEIHELLRQYAGTKLREVSEDEQQAYNRHSAYYLALVQRRDLQQFGSRHMLEEICVNLENIRTAWQWAVRNSKLERIAQSIDGLEDFYEFKGMFHEAQDLFGSAAEQLQTNNSHAKTATEETRQMLIGRLLAVQMRFLIRCSRYETAVQVAQRVLEIASVLGDEHLEAIGSYHWGTALWHQGMYADAQQHLERAAAIAQRLQLQQIHADSVRRLSRVTCEMGKYAEARDYGEQSLAICRTLGERQREARTLNDLGIVADSQGDYVASKTYYERSLQLHREIGDQPGEAGALMNLGAVAADQGEYSQAEHYLEQALHLFREAGNPRDESIVLENLGDSARWQGDVAHATTCYEHALRICRRIGDLQGQSFMLGNLGLVAHQRGDYYAARSYSQQALDIAQEIGDSRARGNALTYLGHALRGLEIFVEATATYQQAIQLYRELELPHLAADALSGLAQIALRNGDYVAALAHIAPILEHLEQGTLDGTAEPFRIYLTCYQVLKAQEHAQTQDILHRAFLLLQQQATRILLEERRQLFLHQVAANQELLQAAKEHRLDVMPLSRQQLQDYRQSA